MSAARIALVTTALASLASCSLFVSSKQAVAISATEPDAEIFVDGALIGRGAATVELQRNKTHAVMAKLGDRTGVATIGNDISSTGALDIVGGVFFLVPLIGIAGPGFWSLDSTTILVMIPPANNSGS